jgi:hypothetical protein
MRLGDRAGGIQRGMGISGFALRGWVPIDKMTALLLKFFLIKNLIMAGGL